MKHTLTAFLLSIIVIIFVKNSQTFSELDITIENLQTEIQLQQDETHALQQVIDIQSSIITSQDALLVEQQEIIEELRTIRNVRVTAYAPLDNQSGICAEGDARYTSTGTLVQRGIVAVDPSRIPYDTKLNIPGYGDAVANDTGGALRNYDGIAIDVLVDTYEEAILWGVRYLDVKIKY